MGLLVAQLLKKLPSVKPKVKSDVNCVLLVNITVSFYI
jgi:hypothetical protein